MRLKYFLFMRQYITNRINNFKFEHTDQTCMIFVHACRHAGTCMHKTTNLQKCARMIDAVYHGVIVVDTSIRLMCRKLLKFTREG